MIKVESEGRLLEEKGVKGEGERKLGGVQSVRLCVCVQDQTEELGPLDTCSDNSTLTILLFQVLPTLKLHIQPVTYK